MNFDNLLLFFSDIRAFFLVYVCTVSVVSAVVCICDKRSAKKGGRRIPEKNLLILCALGGSAVMYITMIAVRHKTKHPKFMLGIPAIIAVQTALYFVLR